MIADLSAVTAPVVAVVAGQPLTEMPADLFIPPDALEVLLDSFSGPLDLLLYLIRRQNLDILDIPMTRITQQYLQYIQLMQAHRLELAADYLVMAAMLAEIKSRLLLPPSPGQEEELEEDPRLALVKKLQAYEQMKQAAILLDDLPRLERDIFRFSIAVEALEYSLLHPDVELSALAEAMGVLIERKGHLSNHQIAREPLSVRERMATILGRLQSDKPLPFIQLLVPEEGRMGLAVTLLAILELARQSLLVITQASAYAVIYLQAPHHD